MGRESELARKQGHGGRSCPGRKGGPKGPAATPPAPASFWVDYDQRSLDIYNMLDTILTQVTKDCQSDHGPSLQTHRVVAALGEVESEGPLHGLTRKPLKPLGRYSGFPISAGEWIAKVLDGRGKQNEKGFRAAE